MIQFVEAEKILLKHKQDLMTRGIHSMSVFGSVARNEATEESDIDILVDVESNAGPIRLARLKLHLEKLLGCKVDLGSYGMLRPALKDRILAEARKVF